MLYATCEPTIAPGECYQHNSLAGKLCLLTCIVGSDREYGRAFVKLSLLLKSNRTGRISAVVILEATQKLDPGQQITVLRNTVVNMGFDTSELAPSSYPKAATEPMFERTEPVTTKVKIEGIDEPAVLSYIEAMNSDNFDAAVALFTADGALQPPFQKPIVGHEAIARYMREEAQGLNMMPQMGISQTLENGSKQLKVTGVVQTPWFGGTVGMNIAWRFLINSEGKIFFVAIDMLASPQELLNLRPM